MSEKRKGLSPRNSTFRDRERLKLCSESHSVAEGSILLDATSVFLTQQRDGEEPTGQVEFSKRAFDALVDWYIREQEPRR